jgi:hypothetical protein
MRKRLRSVRTAVEGGGSRRNGVGGGADDTFITIANKYSLDVERQRQRMERRAEKLR